MIDMDFVVGPHETMGKYDYIWVMVYRLTKPTHFIMVRIDYNVEQLDKAFVKEIIRLHRVPPFYHLRSWYPTHFQVWEDIE